MIAIHRIVTRAIACLSLGLGVAHAQTVAFTFDDGFDPRWQTQAPAWNQAMLKALADAQVHAAYFPMGQTVDSPAGLALVSDWAKAGHLIGNHTYTHTGLSTPGRGLPAFVVDVQRAEALLEKQATWAPRLRLPFLDEGQTPALRDGLRDWMQQHGYRPAPVTIATVDWLFTNRFDAWRAKHPDADLKPWREAYVAHVMRRAEHFERAAHHLLGRSPAHLMLMHTNVLNATFLPDVIAAFKSKGWKLVDAKTALQDPLYQKQPQALPAGGSLIEALTDDAHWSAGSISQAKGLFEAAELDTAGL